MRADGGQPGQGGGGCVGRDTWTATTDEILAKVLITQTNIKKLVENNTKLSQQDYKNKESR